MSAEPPAPTPTVDEPSSPALHPLKEAYLPTIQGPPNQDIRVGIILSAKPTPKALVPAMYLSIDFGPVLGIKNSSTQIVTRHPDPEALVGTKICCVVNVERIRLGRLYSECLVLGVESEEGGTVLVRPDPRAKVGSRVF